MISLKEMVKAAILTRPGDKWPTFDGGTLTRSDFITASEATKCIRLLAFQKNEEKAAVQIDNFWDVIPDEDYDRMLANLEPGRSPQGIFARGHNVEAWVVARLNSVALEEEYFLFTGEEQVSFYDKMHRISGTPDGVYVNEVTGEMWLLEFKSSQNKVTKPKKDHYGQVQVNMGLITHLMQKHNFLGLLGADLPEAFTGAKLLYINSNDYLDMQEFTFAYDGGELYTKMRGKAAHLFPKGELAAPEDVPPAGLKNNGCFFCKYKNDCASIEQHAAHKQNVEILKQMMEKKGKVPPAMPIFRSDAQKEEVIEFLVKYDKYSRDEKEAAAQKDALKDAIKEWVKAQTNMKVAFQEDAMKISASVSISKRAGGLDKKGLEEFFEENGLDLSPFIKDDIDIESLRVSVKPV